MMSKDSKFDWDLTENMASSTATEPFRFVHVSKSVYQRRGQQNCMIQIHDVSSSIMIDYLQTEKELYEIINATVSHEMRNPINSMVYQNENILFVLNQVVAMLS